MTLDQMIWETWACHEALRRLDFPAEKIFIQPTETGLFVVLVDEPRRFAIRVTDEQGDWYEFASAWTNFVTKVLPTIPEATLDAAWNSSTVRGMAVEIVAGLVAKGFALNL